MASGEGSSGPQMKATLGLTGLTMNAMALIAPGAFLWLTFQPQCLTGAPLAASDMWFGILGALLLCLATAVSYAELSKLYPGAGSSYFFAEQAFLSKTHAYKFARLSKFIIGWASHLYYWIYPGVMVGVTALLVGYMAGNFFPDTFNPGVSSPTLMLGFCVIFALGVAYIAYRGVVGATGVNIAINVIQISALIVFSVIAIGYRMSAKDGAIAYSLDPDGNVIKINLATFKVDKDGNPAGKDGKSLLDKDGNLPKEAVANLVPDTDAKDLAASSAKTVKAPDGSWIPALQNYKVDKDGNPVDKDSKSLVGKDGKLPKDAVAKLVADNDNGSPVIGPDGTWLIAADEKGNPALNTFSWAPTKAKEDVPTAEKGKTKTVEYTNAGPLTEELVDPSDPSKGRQLTRQYFENATDVVKPHGFNFIFIQACVAILILVGFESVTSMGEEAKNAKRDIPRAVLLSLLIQGAFCYLFEYFAANFMLNPSYTMTTAAQSSAPIGDMMKLAGAWLFGSAGAGMLFMRIQALTVFLALIGTTLSCINTGARVTYAMGRDDEVPSHFGMLHGKNLTPHRAIWTLAIISIVIGMFAVLLSSASPTATTDLWGSLTDAQKASVWYPSWLVPTLDHLKAWPNTLLVVTLASNFGTFLLYMLTNVVAIVAFREHHSFSGIKHMFIPLFGLIANLICMVFYLIGPFTVTGMSLKEPYIALGVAALWAIYGSIYFARASKKKGKPAFSTAEHKAAGVSAGV
jgi:amino acid transporter